MPQIMARLEEKVDALTETVGKLLQGAMAPMVVTAPEEMVTVKDAAVFLGCLCQGSMHSFRRGVYHPISQGATCFFSPPS